jgi:hypothetical protein
VHCVDEAKAVLHARRSHELRDLARDVDVVAPVGRVEPEFLTEVFHGATTLSAGRTGGDEFAMPGKSTEPGRVPGSVHRSMEDESD